MPWWRRKPEQPEPDSLSRRDFFKKFSGGAVEIIRPGGEDPTRRPPPPPVLPQRPLGRTGATVPILGFGTARLTQQIADDDVAASLLN